MFITQLKIREFQNITNYILFTVVYTTILQTIPINIDNPYILYKRFYRVKSISNQYNCLLHLVSIKLQKYIFFLSFF